MFYINPQTDEKRDLTKEEAGLFRDLIGAIADQDAEYADLILGENSILAHARNERGVTALHFAATEPNAAGIEIAMLLVEAYGASVYALDDAGLTPIHYLNRIADPALKAQFGIAMGIGADIDAILEKLHHEEAVKIATERVEARWAAKKAADAAAEADAKELAYQNADFDGKVAMDPLRAMREYAEEQRVKGITATLDKIIVKAVTDTTLGEEATQAIESLYSKSAKSDQLVYPVNQGLESLLQDMFGSKKSDVDTDTKHSVLGSLCDWLGIDLGQLSYLVSLASNSGFLPFYHGGGNPDDDFGNGPSGGDSAVFFSEPDAQAPTYVVTILGNGTIVIADEPQSM